METLSNLHNEQLCKFNFHLIAIGCCRCSLSLKYLLQSTKYYFFMNVILFFYDCHFEKLFSSEVQLCFNEKTAGFSTSEKVCPWQGQSMTPFDNLGQRSARGSTRWNGNSCGTIRASTSVYKIPVYQKSKVFNSTRKKALDWEHRVL